MQPLVNIRARAGIFSSFFVCFYAKKRWSQSPTDPIAFDGPVRSREVSPVHELLRYSSKCNYSLDF